MPAQRRVIDVVGVVALGVGLRVSPVVCAAVIPSAHTASRAVVHSVGELCVGVQELELHIVGRMQRGDVTQHMVAHRREVALEILADARHNLPVGLACPLVTGIGNLPLVIVSDVRPLQHHPLPVGRATHRHRRKDCGVHLKVGLYLLPIVPRAMPRQDALQHINPFEHLESVVLTHRFLRLVRLVCD